MQVEQNHNNVAKSLTPGGKRIAVGSQTVPVPVYFHCNTKGMKYLIAPTE